MDIDSHLNRCADFLSSHYRQKELKQEIERMKMFAECNFESISQKLDKMFPQQKEEKENKNKSGGLRKWLKK